MVENGLFNISRISNAWKIFAIILFVNILQAIFSPLLNDEPYYWLYAQYPAWGYLDHPPLISLLVKTGTLLLPGEIGVRLFMLILGSFTFFVMYFIIDGEEDKPVNYKLVALLLFSSFFLNLYSFLALPDTPLLFFTVLFLYYYRKYLLDDSLINTLIMGVVTAFLLYSKYHGVLLIGFTILSNPKLLGRRSFYIIMVITLILLIPHIYWQIQNDYPTIRFQLFERSKLDSLHDFLYLPKQLALTGPVILLLFSILYKAKNQFQKTLKYNVIGIFLFFFISSFNGFVNMHWTAIACPAMLCLAYLYINELKKYRRYIDALLILNIIFMIGVRIDVIGNYRKFISYNEENPEVMASILKAKSKGYPLVFNNMYNSPSFFMFYQHQKAYEVNTVFYKKTQFNYLPGLEGEVRGKTVSFVSRVPVNNSSEKVKIPKGLDYYVTIIPNFASFDTGLEIKAISELKYLHAAVNNTINVVLQNKLNPADVNLFKQKGGYLSLNLITKKDMKVYSYQYDKPLDLSNKNPFNFTFKAPAEKGKYRCIFSFITNDKFLIGFDSNTYNIVVQ